jgi:hypothetical protein
MPTPSPLLAFYLGSHPDHRGRLLGEILRQDDDWLESTHDFIQWLFPLPEASAFSPHAPALDEATRRAFLADELLRQHQRAAYLRMLRFFGLQAGPDGVGPGPNWAVRRGNWFTEDTHNSRRITRMIRSLSLLGQADGARAFEAGLQALCDREAGCGISAEARGYWRRALG